MDSQQFYSADANCEPVKHRLFYKLYSTYPLREISTGQKSQKWHFDQKFENENGDKQGISQYKVLW